MNKILKIGLTGGMGSGKSQVLKFLAEKKVPVLQTDFLGHELLKEKSFTRLLVKQFGKSILDSKGQVERKKLAQVVFQDSQKHKILNELSHPLIRQKVSAWIQAQSKKGQSLIVVEVPLLFERGYYRSFDGVLCVSASKLIRQKRLLRRGWNLKEIRRREKYQWPQSRKNQVADWVIFNQSTRKALKYAVNQWLEKIR